MTYLVLDTDVIASALWPEPPRDDSRKLIDLCLKHHYQTVYSREIMREYADALSRERFQLDRKSISAILGFFKLRALPADPLFPSLSRPQCSDPACQKFYDAACCCDALLITWNKEHYPDDRRVLTPAEFFARRSI